MQQPLHLAWLSEQTQLAVLVMVFMRVSNYNQMEHVKPCRSTQTQLVVSV